MACDKSQLLSSDDGADDDDDDDDAADDDCETNRDQCWFQASAHPDCISNVTCHTSHVIYITSRVTCHERQTLHEPRVP